MTLLRAVLFDVDFTLVRPGPELRSRSCKSEIDVEKDSPEHPSLPYGAVSGCGAAW